MKEHEKLLQKAVESIEQGQRLHDDLESYYIPNMKFNEVENSAGYPEQAVAVETCGPSYTALANKPVVSVIHSYISSILGVNSNKLYIYSFD